jgi:hypothetical protein
LPDGLVALLLVRFADRWKHEQFRVLEDPRAEGQRQSVLAEVAFVLGRSNAIFIKLTYVIYT